MPPPRDVHLLVKVARMYFQDGASQQEIADAVGVSRSNVSRMLAAAREQHIVEVRINDPAGRDVELEAALRAQLPLRDAWVAAYVSRSEAVQRVGELGATWLVNELPSVRRLALSWGTTLQALVWATGSSGAARDCEIVPLVGGLSSLRSEITGQELVRELANRIGASYRYLHAPALLGSRDAVAALAAEPSIADALEAARTADVALVGVGTLSTGSSAVLVDQLHLSERDRRRFLEQRPVGDICARFFDSTGTSITGPVQDRVLAVTLDDVRNIPTVVGVAAGANKAPGVRGAIAGGLIDVLICDVALARSVLSISGREA